MEKSDAYVLPGHKDAICLFYKQKKAAHGERKKVWLAALNNSRYSLCMRISSDLINTSIKNYMPYMESRGLELLNCIQDRQIASGGFINLSRCFSDWSYDLMVRTWLQNVDVHSIDVLVHSRLILCMVVAMTLSVVLFSMIFSF